MNKVYVMGGYDQGYKSCTGLWSLNYEKQGKEEKTMKRALDCLREFAMKRKSLNQSFKVVQRNHKTAMKQKFLKE